MHSFASCERLLLLLLTILVLEGNKFAAVAMAVSRIAGSGLNVLDPARLPQAFRAQLDASLKPGDAEFFKLFVRPPNRPSDDQAGFLEEKNTGGMSAVLPADTKMLVEKATTAQSNLYLKVTRPSTTTTTSPENPTCSTTVNDCRSYPNTRCKEGICRCWEGFVWLRETSRCERIVHYRESCNSSQQCDTKGAVCRDGICQCEQRYDRFGNKCLSYNEALSNESYHLIVVCGGISLCILLFALSVCVLKSRSCRREGDLSERRRLLPRYDDLADGQGMRYLLIEDCTACQNVDKPPLYETIASDTQVPIPPPITGSPPPPYSERDDMDEATESAREDPASDYSSSQEEVHHSGDTAVKTPMQVT